MRREITQLQTPNTENTAATMLTMADARIYLDERIQKIMGDLPEYMRNLKGYTVAKLYYKVKEYDTAIVFLQAYLREKDDAMAHKLIANCYRRRKPSDIPKALKHYKRSIEMDSNQPAVKLKLCKLLLNQDMVNSSENYWLDLTTATMRKHLFILEEKINKIHQLQELQTEGIKALSEDLRFLHNQFMLISNRHTQLFNDVQLATETNPLINDHQSDLQALSPLGMSVVDPRATTLELLDVEQELVNDLQGNGDPLSSVKTTDLRDKSPVDTESLPLKPQAYTAQEEDIKFCYMGTLYRYADQEWIDRGFGLIKILRHSTTGVSRLIMRCAETDIISANHQIGADMILSQNEQDKEKHSFLWTANDDAGEQSTMSEFLVQFQDRVTAETFRLAFAKAIEEAKVQQAGASSSSANLKKPPQEQPTHAVRNTLPETMATTGVENMIKLFGGRVDLFQRLDVDFDSNVWKWRGSGELNMLELKGHPGTFRFALREEESDELLLLMSVTCFTEIKYMHNLPKTLICTDLYIDNITTEGVMESVFWRFHSEEAAFEFLSKVKNRLQRGMDQNSE